MSVVISWQEIYSNYPYSFSQSQAGASDIFKLQLQREHPQSTKQNWKHLEAEDQLLPANALVFFCICVLGFSYIQFSSQKLPPWDLMAQMDFVCRVYLHLFLLQLICIFDSDGFHFIPAARSRRYTAKVRVDPNKTIWWKIPFVVTVRLQLLRDELSFISERLPLRQPYAVPTLGYDPQGLEQRIM